MTVNANTPCRFTQGLDHGCKTFEFKNIARSMRTRTPVASFASSRKCIILYCVNAPDRDLCSTDLFQ